MIKTEYSNTNKQHKDNKYIIYDNSAALHNIKYSRHNLKQTQPWQEDYYPVSSKHPKLMCGGNFFIVQADIRSGRRHDHGCIAAALFPSVSQRISCFLTRFQILRYLFHKILELFPITGIRSCEQNCLYE